VDEPVLGGMIAVREAGAGRRDPRPTEFVQQALRGADRLRATIGEGQGTGERGQRLDPGLRGGRLVEDGSREAVAEALGRLTLHEVQTLLEQAIARSARQE